MEGGGHNARDSSSVRLLEGNSEKKRGRGSGSSNSPNTLSLSCRMQEKKRRGETMVMVSFRIADLGPRGVLDLGEREKGKETARPRYFFFRRRRSPWEEGRKEGGERGADLQIGLITTDLADRLDIAGGYDEGTEERRRGGRMFHTMSVTSLLTPASRRISCSTPSRKKEGEGGREGGAQRLATMVSNRFESLPSALPGLVRPNS